MKRYDFQINFNPDSEDRVVEILRGIGDTYTDHVRTFNCDYSQHTFELSFYVPQEHFERFKNLQDHLKSFDLILGEHDIKEHFEVEIITSTVMELDYSSGELATLEIKGIFK